MIKWIVILVPVFASVVSWVGEGAGNVSPNTLKALARELASTGHLYIPQFLTDETVSAFLAELEQAGSFPSLQTATVYQDDGDLTNFPASHPRNIKSTRTLSFTGREALHKAFPDESKSRILSLYQSPVVFDYFQQILHALPTPTDIFLSRDKLGSVYSLRIRPGDTPDGNWHFDEHLFSCVYLLQKPTGGGELQHVKFPGAWEHKNDPNWEHWEQIGKILRNETTSAQVLTVNANVGDAYCFFGVDEMHNIVDSRGDVERVVVVFAYSSSDKFEHAHNIHDKNDWGRTKEL